MGSGVGYLVCFSLRNSFPFLFPASIGSLMEWPMFVLCLLVYSCVARPLPFYSREGLVRLVDCLRSISLKDTHELGSE